MQTQMLGSQQCRVKQGVFNTWVIRCSEKKSCPFLFMLWDYFLHCFAGHFRMKIMKGSSSKTMLCRCKQQNPCVWHPTSLIKIPSLWYMTIATKTFFIFCPSLCEFWWYAGFFFLWSKPKRVNSSINLVALLNEDIWIEILELQWQKNFNTTFSQNDGQQWSCYIKWLQQVNENIQKERVILNF